MKIVNTIDELIKALGLKPGDSIEFTGSQHYRDYELEINFIPKSKEELNAIIETASTGNLEKMGVQIWTTYESQQKEKTSSMWDGELLKPGEVHFLFPSEWYDFIPQGFPIVDIFGVVARFEPGITDNDIRFGCLSFGFVRKETKPINEIPVTDADTVIPVCFKCGTPINGLEADAMCTDCRDINQPETDCEIHCNPVCPDCIKQPT